MKRSSFWALAELVKPLWNEHGFGSKDSSEAGRGCCGYPIGSTQVTVGLYVLQKNAHRDSKVSLIDALFFPNLNPQSVLTKKAFVLVQTVFILTVFSRIRLVVHLYPQITSPYAMQTAPPVTSLDYPPSKQQASLCLIYPMLCLLLKPLSLTLTSYRSVYLVAWVGGCTWLFRWGWWAVLG